MSCQQRSVCRVGCERNRVNTAVAGSRDKLPETGRQAMLRPEDPASKWPARQGADSAGSSENHATANDNPLSRSARYPQTLWLSRSVQRRLRERCCHIHTSKLMPIADEPMEEHPAVRCQHARNRRAAVYRNRDEGPNRGFAIAKPANLQPTPPGVCETGQRFPRRFAIRLDDRLPEAAGDLF